MHPPSHDSLLGQQSWRYFLRKLTGMREFSWTRPIPTRALEACMAVPIAAARWIEEFHPEFKDKPELHLVVAGVERGPDLMNQGRWYQIIPTLLGRPTMKLTVSLVGPMAKTTTRLNLGTGSDPHDIPDGAPGVPSTIPIAKTYPQSLGAFLAEHPDSVDLILLSHPGFESHAKEWLAAGEVPEAVTRGIPVGCLAYSGFEYEHERWIVAQYGFSGTGRFVDNPLALQEPDALMQSAFGSVIWELSSALPPADFEVDEDALQFDHTRNLAYAGAVMAGHGAMVDNAGTLIPKEDGSYFVLLPSGVLVDLADGGLLRVEGDHAVYLDEMLPEAVMADYPPEGSLPYERKSWALDVQLCFERDAAEDEGEPDPELVAAFERILAGRG